MFLLRLVRTTARARPRWYSTLRTDQEHLQDILDQAEHARAQNRWQASSLRQKFVPSMFIRPHYWSYQHRFESRYTKSAPALVAPGRKEATRDDVFHELEIDPLWETSNSTLLGNFVTDLGKIKPRTHTRLTTKTQRRLGKAIRRAKMMGVLPLFYNPRMMSKPGQV